MGLDSELNLAWESAHPVFSETVRHARVSLLLEHSGALDAPKLWRRRGLVQALDEVAPHRASTLRVDPMKTALDRRKWIPFRSSNLSLDPETPV